VEGIFILMMRQQPNNGYGMYSSPERRIVTRKRGLRRLDTRRRNLIKGISQGMTITEAGTYAGYKHRQAAHRAFRSIQLQLPEALERAGYSVDQVLTEVFEKLHGKLEAKKTRFFKYRGIVLETREVEDHRIQLRAAVEICKMLGLFSKDSYDDADEYPIERSPYLVEPDAGRRAANS
jgi:AraC-like DNA-binding protein